MDELFEIKKIVIENLASQIDDGDAKQIAKDFSLTGEQLATLMRRLLDKWLSNPDYIIMIASMLGISMPRKKEKRSNYIG